jgi:aminoacyl-tRNA hydrolase
MEFAAAGKELWPIELQARIARPQIGVVTHVGSDHLSVFRSIEAVAEEKGKLVAALPTGGTAVLNADDPLVLAMRSRCAGRVITYGLSKNAMFRAEDIQSRWPDRLSFTLLCDGQSLSVRTQLCGTHWVHSVLAALSVAHLLGVPLQLAADTIERVPPFPGRMSPVTTVDNITFIRDDQKAPLWTIPSSLDFMRHAAAKRKIVVMGTISDFPGNPARIYPRVARQALEVADHVMFVGRNSSKCLPVKRDDDDSLLRAFVSTDHLLRFLNGFLQPGDLVLLKGSERADELVRIVDAWKYEIQTSNSHAAGQSQGISTCNGTSDSEPRHPAAANHPGVSAVIVGLGNPGSKYERTLHNVGRSTIDVLAESLQAQWYDEDFGLLARVLLNGHPVFLVKPACYLNDTGPLLLRISQRIGFSAENLVLIQDDVDLPFGVLRNRMRGSSGGHNGVQSIIEAFQSEQIRRIKIGVGRPHDDTPIGKYLLRPVDASQRAKVEAACRGAANRALQIINSRPERETN